jgi:hypothetical protein
LIYIWRRSVYRARLVSLLPALMNIFLDPYPIPALLVEIVDGISYATL